MKDNKTKKIEVRLTAEEKNLIQEYCQERQITVSEFVRISCLKNI